MTLATTIGVAAVLWPAVLGLALVDRLDDDVSLASGMVYLAASRVCHQQTERSFHTAGQSWPVCARCAGLYLAAPLGVLAAAGGRSRDRARLARLVLMAAIPTALTWLAEVGAGLPVPRGVRFAAALPLGGVVTFALVSLARAAQSNRID